MRTPALSYFYGILIVLSILYTDLAILGLGLPVALLVAMAMPALLTNTIRLHFFFKTKPVRNATLLYLLFSVCFFLALYLSNNVYGTNLNFLFSLTAQAFWFPILFYFTLYNSELLHTSLKAGLRLAVAIFTLVWLALVISSGDIFTIRNGNSLIQSGQFFFAPAVFDNANLAARAAFVLLALTLFYRVTANTVNESKHWNILSIIITTIIFFTLSRAVISGTIILWVLCIIGSSGAKGRFTKLVLTVAIIVGASTLIPAVSDRVNSGIDRLSESSLGFSNEVVSVQDTTIRGRTWAASIQIIRDNLLTGVGVADALEYMKFYGAVHYKTGEESAIWVHGGFLKIGLYGGFLGLIPFLFLYFYLFLTFLRGYRMNRMLPENQGRNVALLGFSFTVALLPINIGADSFGSSMTWFTLAFILTQLIMARKPRKKSSRSQKPNVIRP